MLANVRPSGLKEIEKSLRLGPVSVPTGRPEGTDHNLIDPSSTPAARIAPSGEKAIVSTYAVCASRSGSGRAMSPSNFQRLIVAWRPSALANIDSSGEKANGSIAFV